MPAVPVEVIPHRSPIAEGPSWYWWNNHLYVRCSECDHATRVRQEVADDGSVSGLIGCEGCGRRQFARLENWSEV